MTYATSGFRYTSVTCSICKRVYETGHFFGKDERLICHKCVVHVKGVGIVYHSTLPNGFITTEDRVQRAITWLKYHDKWDEVNANIVADRLEG